MKNKMIGSIVLVVVLIAGAFYGGMQFAKPKGGLTQQALQNMTPEQRQAAFAGARGAGQGQGMRAGGTPATTGFANGEIISQTDKNLTIKLRDGSSKIVLIADSTKINKSVEGVKTDLVAGKQVMINGTANSDGTITAESITLTPLISVPVPADPNSPVTNQVK